VIDFYKALPDIKYSLNSEYNKALKNVEYKVFDIQKSFKDLDNLNNKDLKDFAFKNTQVFIIPLRDMFDEIIGFILRSVEGKAFHTYAVNRKYPMIFGLNDFKDFKINEPILLTEGIKDAMVLKQYYKYSLAYLTSQPSDKFMEYLENITNRIIFFPDNDNAGKKLKFNDFRKYTKYYVPYGKDLGEYWEEKEEIGDWIKVILEKEKII
jgi:DNA primase